MPGGHKKVTKSARSKSVWRIRDMLAASFCGELEKLNWRPGYVQGRRRELRLQVYWR